MLNPVGITRTQVGHSLSAADGEVQYYAAHGSSGAPTLFPGQTASPITGDDRIPYGSWSVEAGRGAGGWIASAMDMLRFQMAVNGRGAVQVYPNIYSDILSTVGQPTTSFDWGGDGAFHKVDPATQRYMAGWSVQSGAPASSGFDINHFGSVNGSTATTESLPDAPGFAGYGIATLINTSSTDPNPVNLGGAVHDALLSVTGAKPGTILDPAWSSDTNFFDQYGAFGAYTDAATLNGAIAAASARGCTYQGRSYAACYASRLEGTSTSSYRAQIVPLHSQDAAKYVLGATCTAYVNAQQSFAAAGYQPVSLQWYVDPVTALRRFQAVWVKIKH